MYSTFVSVIFIELAKIPSFFGFSEVAKAPKQLIKTNASCQTHSIEWHCSRSGAGGAVLLSDRSVEQRSDGGHFGSAGGRASG